jgi:C-terminal processing protease CtpA/Prc
MKLKQLSFFFLSLMATVPSLAQQYGNNLDFENFDKRSKTLTEWSTSKTTQYIGPTNIGYTVQPDSRVKQNGSYSLRIEAEPNVPEHTFGAAIYAIPSSFEGRRIVLKGYVKTQDVDTTGYAGLWMRLDGSNGMDAFDNMDDRKIKGTTDWKEYTIDLPISRNTRRILFGGLLDAPAGKVWIDNLRVFIDGVEVSKAKAKTVKALQEPGNEFVNGSGIHFGSLTPQRINDLSLLGKVWGFLKYHHPAVAEARYNWDTELFKIMPSYLSAKDSIERDQVLVNWINKLGPVDRCFECNDAAALPAKQNPDFLWIDQTSSTLQSTLKYVLDNRNLAENYYVKISQGATIFQENTYSYFVYPDDGYRVLALYRYWNIIQYYYPYKYAIGENWNSTLAQFIPKFLDDKNALQYRLTFLELIGRIHDTHANLWGTDSVMINYKGRYIAPLKARFVEDKLVISAAYESAVEPQVRIGDVIIAIDNMPVEEYVKNNSKYYPASNVPSQLRNISRDILRTKNRTMDLSIQNEKGKSLIKMSTISIDDYDRARDYAWNYTQSCCYLLNDNVGYINLGNGQASLLPEIMNSFKSTKGIIVDIRSYPSESFQTKLTEYFMGAPKPFVSMSRPNLSRPGQFLLEPSFEVGKFSKDYYKGKVVVLVNELSQSNSEFTTMALQAGANTTVIGSTSAGADGNTARFILPGNLVTYITALGVYYPDGRETQRVGIVPDIIVKPTILGIREGRDELIEKAISIIQR